MEIIIVCNGCGRSHCICPQAHVDIPVEEVIIIVIPKQYIASIKDVIELGHYD